MTFRSFIHKKIMNWFDIMAVRLYPRPSTLFIKNHFQDKELAGAEVGVYEGSNAESVLKTLKISKLYLIDPYINDYNWRGNNLNEAKITAFQKLNNYPVEFIYKKSYEANVSELDFVYIDANHSYESVKKDIEIYWNKIKSGGVLAGHDFIDNPHENTLGVIKAVIEFAVKNNLQLYVSNSDWWVVK